LQAPTDRSRRNSGELSDDSNIEANTGSRAHGNRPHSVELEESHQTDTSEPSGRSSAPAFEASSTRIQYSAPVSFSHKAPTSTPAPASLHAADAALGAAAALAQGIVRRRIGSTQRTAESLDDELAMQGVMEGSASASASVATSSTAASRLGMSRMERDALVDRLLAERKHRTAVHAAPASSIPKPKRASPDRSSGLAPQAGSGSGGDSSIGQVRTSPRETGTGTSTSTGTDVDQRAATMRRILQERTRAGVEIGTGTGPGDRDGDDIGRQVGRGDGGSWVGLPGATALNRQHGPLHGDAGSMAASRLSAS